MKHIKFFEDEWLPEEDEKNINQVNLENLVGSHLLSGVDNLVEKPDGWYSDMDDAQVLIFVLDGITYKAKEDPQDGYRSSLGYVEIVKTRVRNTFPAHEVIGRMKDQRGEDERTSHVIEFIDAETLDPVLEIGTDNYDDYYPSCVLYFNPDNLALNRAMNKYNL